MKKHEFLDALRKKLGGIPKTELEERLRFYGEMIDDRIEDGMIEEVAVSDVGSVEEVAMQIIADMPLAKLAKEKIKPKRRLAVWEIVLLAIGSPIWLSLAIATAAVVLSLYVVLWSLALSLWAIFASLLACALGGVVAGAMFAISSSGAAGIAVIGGGVLCAGLAIFLFFGCRSATNGTALFAKKIILSIKKCFIGKEAQL